MVKETAYRYWRKRFSQHIEKIRQPNIMTMTVIISYASNH
jgi:hypothetical protein